MKGPKTDFKIDPSPLSLANKISEPLTTDEIYENLKQLDLKKRNGFFCVNFMELFKSVDLEAEPTVEYTPNKADEWRELYYDLLAVMGDRSVLQTMDCVLNFQVCFLRLENCCRT